MAKLQTNLPCRHILCAEQLPHDRFKHGITHKLHQLHLSSISMATQAGIELGTEGVAEWSSG